MVTGARGKDKSQAVSNARTQKSDKDLLKSLAFNLIKIGLS